MAGLGARKGVAAVALSLAIAGPGAGQTLTSVQLGGLVLPPNFSAPLQPKTAPTVNDAAAAANGALQQVDPTRSDQHYAGVLQPDHPVGLVADSDADKAQSSGLVTRQFVGTLGDERLTMRFTVSGDNAFVKGLYGVADAQAVPLTASGDAFAFTLQAPDGAVFHLQLVAADEAAGLVTLRNAVRLDGVWREGDRELPVKLSLAPQADRARP
jgi:hypothetical protein